MHALSKKAGGYLLIAKNPAIKNLRALVCPIEWDKHFSTF